MTRREIPVPADKFCCACGADDSTDRAVVTGFLLFPVATPQSALGVKYLCDACLSMLLAVVLQRVSSLGSRLAAAAIENQAAGEGAPGDG